jgi:hypothetical protein
LLSIAVRDWTAMSSLPPAFTPGAASKEGATQ